MAPKFRASVHLKKQNGLLKAWGQIILKIKLIKFSRLIVG